MLAANAKTALTLSLPSVGYGRTMFNLIRTEAGTELCAPNQHVISLKDNDQRRIEALIPSGYNGFSFSLKIENDRLLVWLRTFSGVFTAAISP